MAVVVSEARAILDQFTRDGYLSPNSVERAKWGDWGQVTPAWVLLLSLKALILFRWEEGRNGSELLPGIPVGLPRNDADALVEVLRGNLSAARVAGSRGVLTLERVLTLLVYVVAEEAMTREEVGVLLESAQAMNEEMLRSGDLLRPPYRGVDVGPWDIGEAGWQTIDLLDFGGLKVPRRDVRKVELNQLRSGEEYGEVVLFRDATASLQLQAFRTCGNPEWGRVLVRLESDVRARGGEVERWSGRAGVELRATVPVVGDARGRGAMTVRFIGCDGPGWILRGVVNGEAALCDSRDEWAYRCFENVVVTPSFEVRTPTVSASPASYSPIMPREADRVIPLQFPE
ncbi:DUF3710 domain-containing protein [Streptomyces sp. NPDC002054]|uniref:DUF3710 domain-containing protein n=1 Tax=Streptomyces sp. NPDC002054 TaxID=3154663 RepID=UPI00332435E8